MRICLDLDGVICTLRSGTETYEDVEPIEGAVEGIRALRAMGHTVIIYTARHMKTQGGDVGKVIATQGLTTLGWLERHGVEFDEIHFGKPWAHIYVDDNATRFRNWGETLETIATL